MTAGADITVFRHIAPCQSGKTTLAACIIRGALRDLRHLAPLYVAPKEEWARDFAHRFGVPVGNVIGINVLLMHSFKRAIEARVIVLDDIDFMKLEEDPADLIRRGMLTFGGPRQIITFSSE